MRLRLVEPCAKRVLLACAQLLDGIRFIPQRATMGRLSYSTPACSCESVLSACSLTPPNAGISIGKSPTPGRSLWFWRWAICSSGRPRIAALTQWHLFWHISASRWDCCCCSTHRAWRLAAGSWQLPLAADLVAIAVFLLLTRSAPAFWFLYLFVALAAGMRWGLERSILLAGAVTLAVLVRATFHGGFGWAAVFSWVALAVGTFTAGVGLAFLGDQNRLHAAEHEYLARLTGMLQIEHGVTESLRMMLDELARGFECEQGHSGFSGCRARARFRLERAGRPGRTYQSRKSSPGSRGCLLARSSGSVGLLEPDGCARSRLWVESPRRPALVELPRMPAGVRQRHAPEFDTRSHLRFRGAARRSNLAGQRQPPLAPRICNGLSAWCVISRPPLENLFLLRRLRTRAIEGERSRISRDIHDGILQTLLSVDIQLDVLRRKLPQAPEQVAATWERCSRQSEMKRRAAAHGHRHAPAGRAERRSGGLDARFCASVFATNPAWRSTC